MRILHFIDSLRLGGKERQVVELIKGLSKKPGINQCIISMSEDDFYKPEVEKSNIPIELLIRSARWDPFIFFLFYKAVKRFKPDIVHTNSMLTSFYALPITKILGIKLVNGSIRNAFDSGGTRWKLERLLLYLSEVRVANSKAGLLSRGFVKSKKNIVIYNGFDFDRVNNKEFNSSALNLPGSDDKKIIGMVAEFNNNKDYQTYIDAALLFLKQRSDVKFYAVGDGENLDNMKKLIPNDIRDFYFLGKIKDVENIIKYFSIGVLTTYTEGISNAIMEYMALEKPVIVTNGGGSNEIVKNGKNGFLIRQRDSDALCEKMELLIENPDLAREMGEKGKKDISQTFSFDKMIEEYTKLFQSIINNDEV